MLTCATFLTAGIVVVSTAATQNAIAMGASFSWRGTSACSSTSPAFKLSDVPSGTKTLSFSMVDKDKPTFNHGGGTVAYTGPSVARGAFNYTGPCPPPGETHTYAWTVEAIDGSGKVLATARAQAAFPAK